MSEGRSRILLPVDAPARGGGRVAIAMIVAAVAVMTAAGCKSSSDKDEHPEPMTDESVNADVVHMIFDQQARAAVVAERTVYPYHFEPEEPTLSPLGREHVETLAAGLRTQGAEGRPLRLNVRRGNASEALYEARRNEVRNQLEKAGVAIDQLTLEDGVAGGKGVESARLAASDEEKPTNSAGTRSPSSSSGGGYRPSSMNNSNGNRRTP